MIDKDAFIQHVQDAYRHLYDLVYLRNHPLVDYLIQDRTSSIKDRAWLLHHELLRIIDELETDPSAQPFSPAWRRHRLLVMRYIEGVAPQEIADELNISRRHFYREQDGAVMALAELLWEHWRTNSLEVYTQTWGSDENQADPHMELLRREAAQISDVEQSTRLDRAVKDILCLFEEIARQRSITVNVELEPVLPEIALDPALLRQLLISIIGYWFDHMSSAVLTIAAQMEGTDIRLSTLVNTIDAVYEGELHDERAKLDNIHALASVIEVKLSSQYRSGALTELSVLLPPVKQYTVLVVDDNRDALHLFSRYLIPNHYTIVTAATIQDAIGHLDRALPDAIILDLMMPGQDGWDLLRVLRSRPETGSTPIIVCSVMRQKVLALALGATGFLEKPVQESTLLDSLRNIGLSY